MKPEHKTHVIGERNHYSCVRILIMALSLLCVNALFSQNTKTPKPLPTGNLYLRAPAVLPGTTPQMREASYWVKKMSDPDKIVLTFEQIQKKNDAYHERMKDLNNLNEGLRNQVTRELKMRPGLLPAPMNIGSIKDPGELSKLVQDWVGSEIDFLGRRVYGNMLSIQYSDDEIREIEREMGYDVIEKEIKIVKGLTVRSTLLRIIPKVRFEYIGNTDRVGWDMWNFDVLPVGEGVEVLHKTRSGSYLFVLTSRGYGWVKSDDVALGDAKTPLDFDNNEHFILCAGDIVPFYTDSSCNYASGWLRMGDRVPIAGKNRREILIPVRRTDGTLEKQKAWLRESADVSIGYLPFTKRNVVEQAFKLLDNIYDWTGGWYGRDHATQLRDIFSVFGFKFPSMGGLLSAYNQNSTSISPEEGQRNQFNAMLSHNFFLTLQICSSGHSQLLLGEQDGMPIVFDTHGYSYKDNDGNELIIRRANVGTVLFPGYFLKQEIRFIDLAK